MRSTLSAALAMSALAAPALAAPAHRYHGGSTTEAATTAAAPAAEDFCTVNGNLLLPDTPWIVYNMFYDEAQSVGTQCTRYDSQTTSANGTKEVVWSSETNIEYVKSTDNIPKGYSFIGLTENLPTQLSAISSIPATYSWTRTNTTAFKGNECFDFIVAPTSGDSTSTAAIELMLWLNYEDGQLPIGWDAAGPAATIDNLFGTSWSLYEGTNTGTGLTVHSMLPKTMFDGAFEGDLKEWFAALVALGRFKDTTYVNVGNAGTEMFFGNSILNATLGLQINL